MPKMLPIKLCMSCLLASVIYPDDDVRLPQTQTIKIPHPGSDNQNTAANHRYKCKANSFTADLQSSSLSVHKSSKMRGCMIAVLLLYALTTSCSAQGGQSSLWSSNCSSECLFYALSHVHIVGWAWSHTCQAFYSVSSVFSLRYNLCKAVCLSYSE